MELLQIPWHEQPVTGFVITAAEIGVGLRCAGGRLVGNAMPQSGLLQADDRAPVCWTLQVCDKGWLLARAPLDTGVRHDRHSPAAKAYHII